MKKILFVLVLLIAFVAASCGETYKVRNLRTNDTYVITWDEGYWKGDTTIMKGTRVVVDSVMK